MKKVYFPSLMLLSVTSFSHSKDIFTQMWQEMRDFEEKMHIQMEKAFSSLNSEFDNSSSNYPSNSISDIKFNEDENHVTIDLSLDCQKIKQSNIFTQAKDNNLEGNMEFDDKKLNFFIKNGRFFETSLSYKSENEPNKDNKKTKQRFYTTANLVRTLPTLVTNLENSKITCEKNIVKLILPKLNNRQGWKKIEVKEISN